MSGNGEVPILLSDWDHGIHGWVLMIPNIMDMVVKRIETKGKSLPSNLWAASADDNKVVVSWHPHTIPPADLVAVVEFRSPTADRSRVLTAAHATVIAAFFGVVGALAGSYFPYKATLQSAAVREVAADAKSRGCRDLGDDAQTIKSCLEDTERVRTELSQLTATYKNVLDDCDSGPKQAPSKNAAHD